MTPYQYDPDRNERIVSLILEPHEARRLKEFAKENNTTTSALIRGMLRYTTDGFQNLTVLLEHQDFKPRGGQQGSFKSKYEL